MKQINAKFVKSNSTYCIQIFYLENWKECINVKDAKSIYVLAVGVINKKFLMKMANGRVKLIESAINAIQN